MIKITVDEGLHRSLQRRVDGSSDHLHDKTTQTVSTKQVNAANTTVLLFTQVNLLHYQIWKKKKEKKKRSQTATIIKTPYVTTASNRTLLEKNKWCVHYINIFTYKYISIHT